MQLTMWEGCFMSTQSAPPWWLIRRTRITQSLRPFRAPSQKDFFSFTFSSDCFPYVQPIFCDELSPIASSSLLTYIIPFSRSQFMSSNHTLRGNITWD
ncbi:uncharacterized protein N7518_006679 [Penicillium psychrosexuale]|uniref:uncharacterized protein n=1 Tax=Penicillium psychrosexuale TaxID=1002107 RepID=UPI002544D499|nr:uncharacterized protein N7518_006679 [Penicillium psychrosexuale]KAJ5789668.1 hypothetical protein N7518_006679 [Penicillium psychrosexuale]